MVTLDDELKREFEERLIETSTLAFRIAFSVLRHRQDAEDVAQDALTKADRSFRQLRDRDRFRAWLVRTTWRAALDRQRANRRRGAHEVPADTPALAMRETSSAVAAGPDSDTAALWSAIDALPDKLRIVIVLASIEGHGLRDVAALLKIPEGTVKSRLFLARQHLKEWLQ
jgi:RNA polymerase sigma-70 factor (ECF subfamily)